MEKQDQYPTDYCRISLYVDLDLLSQIEELSNRLRTTKMETIYHAILLYLKYNENRDEIFDALESEKTSRSPQVENTQLTE